MLLLVDAQAAAQGGCYSDSNLGEYLTGPRQCMMAKLGTKLTLGQICTIVQRVLTAAACVDLEYLVLAALTSFPHA